MEYRRRLVWAGFGLVMLALLSACSGPTPLPTLRPVLVTVYLTGTPVPAQGATATVSSSQPANTPTPPVASSPATPSVSGPDTYPPNVNPLTGQVVDPAQIQRMPIAIKISNFPYSARPQSGLSLADVVFEHLAEAGLTRFTAVFLQNDAAKVGSIRSARFIDTEIAPMFGAILVTSGSSLGTMQHFRANAWFQGANIWRLVSEETSYVCPPLCRSSANDINTLFASTTDLRAATAAKAGANARGQSGFVFSPAVPPGGAAAATVLVDFSPSAHVQWVYNAAANVYARWQDTDASGVLSPHVDALTNTPITARNVVVLFVSQVNNFVPEDFLAGGDCGLEIQLWTIGPAKVFRDGRLIEGRWHRDASTSWRLRLEDNSGNSLPLSPGNTWFSVVGLTAIGTLNGNTYSVLNHVLDTRTECPVPPSPTPTETPVGYVAPTATVTLTPTP